MSLSRCEQCDAFAIDGVCPLCGGARVRATKLGAVAALLGSSAFGMTLMACYGCPDGKCTDEAPTCGYYGANPPYVSQVVDDAGDTTCVPNDASVDSGDAAGDAGSTPAPDAGDAAAH